MRSIFTTITSNNMFKSFRNFENKELFTAYVYSLSKDSSYTNDQKIERIETILDFLDFYEPFASGL
jgi:hypothetical protein